MLYNHSFWGMTPAATFGHSCLLLVNTTTRDSMRLICTICKAYLCRRWTKLRIITTLCWARHIPVSYPTYLLDVNREKAWIPTRCQFWTKLLEAVSVNMLCVSLLHWYWRHSNLKLFVYMCFPFFISKRWCSNLLVQMTHVFVVMEVS